MKLNIRMKHKCPCTWAAEDAANTLNPPSDCPVCAGEGEMSTTVLGVTSYEVFNV